MIARRDFLVGAALAGLAPVFSRRACAETTGEGAKLRALFDAFFAQRLQRDPELATSLGLDKGENAGLKRRLGDMSLDSIARDHRETEERLTRLRGIDRAALSPFDAVSYDTVRFVEETRAEAHRLFGYAGGSAGEPYVLTQLSGAYQWLPDFLDREHAIANAEDAEAYLARLGEVARVMDEELAIARHDEAELGVAPPDFILDKTLAQMKIFLDTPAQKAVLVQSLVRRTREKSIAGDWEARAAAIYDEKICPALARQAAFLEMLSVHAIHDADVGRLPSGADYYRVALRKFTTGTLSPEEIHTLGLDLVAELSAEISRKLDAQNVAPGAVGQRLAALAADPKYLYDNTDEGRKQLLADLNLRVSAALAKLPLYFAALPKAAVEIRAVPKEIELGAPGGYYQHGSLDGSRPGAYYINLRDTAELARWKLPTLTFHESVPGHHVQITLANEAAALPLIRKITGFSGYAEGWALYAEQLAVEIGLYDGDPLGHIGQLQAALFRAARLVVDSGLHAKGWSRERAIAYFVETLGDRESAATTEVERYCVWPGQACSYMVGKLTFLRQRDKAQKILGEKFDLRKFHDAALLSGSMPLAVMERVLDDFAAGQKT